MESFKYLGCVLHRTDEDWPAVFRNIARARQVWGSLGKFLRREVADPIVATSFYRAVVQAVLIFWGRNMGLDGNDAVKTGGGKRGFLEAGDGDVGA